MTLDVRTKCDHTRVIVILEVAYKVYFTDCRIHLCVTVGMHLYIEHILDIAL